MNSEAGHEVVDNRDVIDKTVIVVAIRCRIPITVGRTQVVRIIVPGAAAQNTVLVRFAPFEK